jgi:tetratricopeptide (TPR) repeat protein
MRYLILSVVLLPAWAFAQAPAGADAKALIADIDRLWPTRDQGDGPKEVGEKVAAALAAAPDDFEVLWRAARWHVWVGDGLPNGDQKEAEGKLGWELGDKASAKNPAADQGWHYAAAGIGVYSQAISIVTALMKGMEGKFLERLNKALAINPDADDGNTGALMGRYFYELPWPKYDGNKSLEWLGKGIAKHPKNARLHFYMAQTLLKEGKAKEAMSEVTACLAIDPASGDAPEGRRMQERCRTFKPKVEKELK